MKTNSKTTRCQNMDYVATKLLGRLTSIAQLIGVLFAAVPVLSTLSARASVIFTSIASFQILTNGGYSRAALVQGSDGSFYGTTEGGGAYGYGTVFQVTANGVLRTLASFEGTNGAYPECALVQGSDGSFYGTTGLGGTSNYGTVFKITSTGTLNNLHLFTGRDDGENPPAGLVQGSDGNFYGTTALGGAFDGGTVFRIGTNGALTTLHSFRALDGENPAAGLVQGSDGWFYGTTGGGGASEVGTVFKISTNGGLTNLYSFTGGNDGEGPSAALVQGSDGWFYGTTTDGGAYPPNGTVFRISTNGTLTTLYSFAGNVDGRVPMGSLVQGSDGNFYGTTTASGTNGYGTVFKMSINGDLTSLYSFTGGNDGREPYGGMVQGSDGGFYGTTEAGGAGGAGTVFRITVVAPPPPVFQSFTPTNSALILTWSTEAGATYQLQFNPDLASGNWSNLGNATTAAGATLSATDSITNGPRRFYRVVLLP